MQGLQFFRDRFFETFEVLFRLFATVLLQTREGKGVERRVALGYEESVRHFLQSTGFIGFFSFELVVVAREFLVGQLQFL